MKKNKMYNTTINTKNDNVIHIENNYKHLANPLHFAIQQTYRCQVQEDKTKYKRCRDKKSLQREIANY